MTQCPKWPGMQAPGNCVCENRLHETVGVCMILDQAVGSLYTITFFTGKFVELLPPLTNMPSPARASLFPLRHRQVAFSAMLGHSRADVLTKAHLPGISARHV